MIAFATDRAANQPREALLLRVGFDQVLSLSNGYELAATGICGEVEQVRAELAAFTATYRAFVSPDPINRNPE